MHRSGALFGTYRVIHRQGKNFIVLSGYAGLRRYLTAPVYGVGNPKVIKMGIGQAAAKGALKTGAVLTLILSPAVRTLEWLFTDELKKMEAMLAHIATDIAKGFITAGAAYFAAAMLLNMVDNKLGLTEKLADALIQHKESWATAMEENRRSVEQIRREANYYFGSTRGNLDFIRRFGGW
ncbi:hypothetical protein [Marinobacter sp. ANT_B65]|uniref:hypothetical protein n=1 Tax=Marinobacter sp. ANT_B65 TaxID=2039467 RepID=UPI000BBE1F1C|nr:hypothetical protein [Marinobacter sp. ANT_B65]PCM42977.1 hypothetical protein CPA50_17985 [Marinobacter sp. ANT_B65]